MPADLNKALVQASGDGRIKAVKLLLPVSNPKAGSSLALQMTAKNGHLEIVELLLLVSDPKADSSWALRLATGNGHLEVVRLLLPVSDLKSNDSWALRHAAKSGHLEIVKLLLPRSNYTEVLKLTHFVDSVELPRTHAMLALDKLRTRQTNPAPAGATPRLRA